MTAIAVRKKIHITGVVQGVGFRPYVYRTAARFGLSGFVLNSPEGVTVEAEGDSETLHRFLAALQSELPPLARIDRLTVSDLAPQYDSTFTIRESAPSGLFALVPPDIATCPDCVQDLTSPDDRRFAYPFTNCVNCGPRYSIIRDIPYDRPKTTMAAFPMCPCCQAEYKDPADRRFHAEPNACPQCGPGLALLSAAEMAAGVEPEFASSIAARAMLQRARQLLFQGEILAIKGLGGFHLACNASSDRAVGLLRERKRRNGKAFALMARDIAAAERLCAVTEAGRALLLSPRRPIVLLPRRSNAHLSTHVAPGNSRLGVMLPYTPLHLLLFEDSPGYDALVMTSGNLSEEPIVSRNEEAFRCLHTLADYFLLHNREIQTRVDDSVIQSFQGREYPVRRSRGFAPEPIRLHAALHEILACGGELKNTLCLTKDRYAILSPHIGDLENLETMEFFLETLAHLKRFFRVSPIAVAHDLHPGYLSTRYALQQSELPPVAVQHHHAHIASCMADNGLTGRVIGVALDGTGYGTDGQIWGGEFLACGYDSFDRRGHFAYVPLAGGDSAVRQPWRSALTYLMAAYGPVIPPMLDVIPPASVAAVRAMIQRCVQTVETSSCGRLFDAVASILGLRHEATYEGQAAIELESAASGVGEAYPFAISAAEFFQIDFRETIRAICADKLRGVAVPQISANFHSTLTRVIADACDRMREIEPLCRVCLSGGTFQNLRLLELAGAALGQRGFEVFTHRRVPANDGGLSLGQAVIANQMMR